TGQPPHRGKPVSELIEQIATGPTPTARRVEPWVPPALEAVCARAMSREPAARYASASELADDVQRYLADQPVLAYREPWPERAGRFLRNHRTWAQASAAALSLITIVSLVALVLINQARHQTVEALNRTDEQRQRAERNYHMALDAVNTFLTRVSDEP